MQKFWKCDSCESSSRYKGLCRECTEYSKEGVILKAVPRVRKNPDGTNWQPPQQTKAIPVADRLQMIRQNRRRKPNKKQIQNMLNSMEVDSEEMMDIGESVEEEE